MSASSYAGTSKQQRDFVLSWVNEFPCIEDVPNDKKKFFCTVCEQAFVVVNKERVISHIESKGHKKCLHNGGPCTKKMYAQKFLTKWLEDIRFKSWLQTVPGDEYKFCCTLCSVDRACSSGVSTLIRHAESPDHINKCIEKGVRILKDIPPEDIQDSIETFESRKSAREIEYAKLGCATHTPFISMSKFLKFFQATDPKVLQHMTVGATKMSSIVRKVLGPSEESRLIEILRSTKFSVHIDETTDPNGSTKWMTFLVRYVDSETVDTMTGLPKLINLNSTDLTATGIFNAFKKFMDDNLIPFANILAVACDNAAVMIGDNKSFKTLILKQNPSIIIIPCICHKLALIAKDACNKTMPSYIDSLLQSIVHHMNSSTKRSEAFKEFTMSFQESNHKILSYAKTRWLGRHACIERVRELYPSLLAYFTELCFSEKSNKSFQEIRNQLQDIKTQAYLAFLEYILFQFNKINLFFQHSETRVHLLNSKSLEFLKFVARHFLKRPLLEFIGISEVNFRLPNNQKPLDQVDFGPDCNDILEELSRDIEENLTVLEEIRRNCLAFYVETVSQILSRLYFIHDELFMNLSVFDAKRALLDSDRDNSFVELWYFACTFGGFDKVALKTEWRLLHRHFSSRPELEMHSFDYMWKTVFSRSDANGSGRYPQLKTLVGYIRSLPHSNAAAERAFSMLPDISTKKRNSLSVESINAIAVVKSAMKLEEKTSRTAEVSEDQLARMSSDNLYEPPKKRTNALRLHAADD